MQKTFIRSFLIFAIVFVCGAAYAQQGEISYTDDFQSYGTQKNPPGWVDTSVGGGNGNGLYKTWPDPLQGNHATNVVYGTKQSSGKPEGNHPRIGTFSTYTAKTFAGRGRFEYRGRFIKTSADTRVGVSFFSSYPETDRYYLAGLWSQPNGTLSMQLFSFGAGTLTGTTNSGFTPAVDKWYRFAIQADDAGNVTSIRARFWLDGQSEPSTWSIDARDSSAQRLTSGRIGIWSAVKGDAYVDDISAKAGSDSVPPAISFVDGDTGATLDRAAVALFKSPARIDVRITDQSAIATKTIKLDGADYTPLTPVAADGAHAIVVHAVDASGNAADATLNFLVDTTDPVVTVFANGAELAAGAAFQQNVTLTWTVADLTPDTVTATLDGTAVTTGVVVSAEAVHTLIVTAKDKAGHQTIATRTFVVDKTRPEVHILANGAAFVEGKAFDKPVVFTFDIRNNTPTTTTAKIDGTTYTGQTISGEGAHTIYVKVTNAAGLFTELGPFPFVVDVTKPQVTLTESGAPFANGAKFSRDVLAVVTATDNLTTTPEKHLLVDGSEYPPGTAIASESADHTIEATAVDDAGNTATTGVLHFVLDKTKPVVTITDGNGNPFATNAVFNAPVTIRIVVADVTSAIPVATLNGAAVALTKNGNVWTSAPIGAEGTYSVSVIATDQVGLANDPVAASFRVDTTAPAIAFTAPPQNANVAAPSIVVSGTSDDAVAIVVNGREAEVDGQARTFRLADVVLLEGNNEITAVATDAAGNTKTATLLVNLDTRAPELVVTSPAPNACFTGREVQVTGRANDPNLTTIRVGGATATRNADGTWAATVPLGNEGKLALTVVAEDGVGHVAAATIPIAVDRTKPAIDISESGAPFAGGFVNRAVSPFVRVTDASATTVTTTLNGAAYSAGTAIANDGAYTLHVVARDCAGNTTDANVAFTIDRVAPQIASLDPADGTTIGAKRAITGTLDSDDVQSVTSGGVPASIANRTFTLDAPLGEGVNRFGLTVTDKAGNASTRAYSFSVKTSSPDIEILENGSPIPANALYARAVTPVIRSNEPGVTIAATLDGAPFTSGTTIAANGEHTLRATANDAFGHSSAEATATFTVDTTPPTVQITAPANGATVGASTVVVEGTTNAETVTINGASATITAGTFSATIALEPGPNAIVAIARDRAGNSAIHQIDVARGDDRPGILLTSPPDGMLTNRGTTTVAGQLLTADTGAKVTINGIEAGVGAAGAFRVDDFALHEGDNAITAAIAGTTRAVTVHINADFTPPALTVLANGAEMGSGARYETSPSITLAASDTNPGVTTTLTIDGTAVTGATPAVSNAGHVLVAIARDAAGNQVRVERTFFVGPAGTGGGCALTNFDPAGNSAIFASSVRLTGRSGAAAKVTVNGVEATLDSGSFAASVQLTQEGANAVSIACDANGPVTLTLYRYTNAPSITIDALPPVLTSTTTTVGGTVGAGVVSGDVNGIAFTPANGRYSVAGISLGSGLNVITARAKNAAGRIGVATANVIVANAAPQLAITSPLPATETGAASLDVSGTYANADPATIAITGATITTHATSDTTGTFTAASVPLAGAGTTTITATARNRAGAQTSTSVDVLRITGPSIAIATPADNTFTRADEVTVTGTISAGAGASVQLNGVAATLNGSQFTAAITTSNAGVIPVIARVTTPDGKSASDSIRVIRVPAFAISRTYPEADAAAVDVGAAMVVLFTNPIDGATVNGAATLVPDGGAAITGTTFADNDALSFAPHVPLEPGKRYTFTIAQTLKDLSGSSLASPFTLSFTAATTAPSVAPDVDQSDDTGCFSTRTITGTASVAGARVRLDLDGVPASTTAGADRKFAFTFSFSGQPGFHIARVREIGVDGTLSPERAIAYRINCAGPQVVSASLDRAQKKLTIQFSRPMNPATLTIRLGTFTGTLSMNVANDVATVAYTNDLSMTLTLTVTKDAKDTNGVPLAADYVQTFPIDAQEPVGKGYISGAVYDASSGRPLENATVVIATTNFPADARGRYVTSALAEGAYTIEARANGFTSAWRQVVVPSGVGVVPIDIRLTRRGVAQPTGNALTLRHGGDTAVTNPIEATIPAVAIPSGHTISLTSIGGQSLAGLLPLGWSPLASAELAIDGSSIPQPMPASKLTFTASTADVALVLYDEARDEWRTVIAVAAANTPLDIQTSGNYALVYPDRHNPPPPARAGAALQGVTNPCAINGVGLSEVCRLVSTSFTVNPPSVAPSGRTTATLAIAGAGKDYPSGTAVQAYIDEQLNLADGTVRIDPPFATDLLIYRTPSGDAGQAVFHMAPTAQAATVTLRDGIEHIRVVEYPGRIDRGALLGAEGGRVAGDDAISIDIPAGATLDALHASVTPMSASELNAVAAIPGFHVAGGFTLALTRAGDANATPVTLLKPARGTFTLATNQQVIVAEVMDAIVRLAAATVSAPAPATGVKIFTTKEIDRTQLPVDGIVRAGRYLVLTADAPIAFAWGRVRLDSATGPAIANARVASALGVFDLTRIGGTFAIPVPAQPAAPFSLRARSSQTGEGAPAVFPRSPAPDESVAFGDLVLAAQPPTQVTITPDGVEVPTDAFQAKATFDVAIDRDSAATGFTLFNATTGTPVAGVVSVVGPVVTFTPSTALAAGSRYVITVAPTIRSASGAPFGRLATAEFTTHALPPNNTTIHPEKISITIPENGISTIRGSAGSLPTGAIALAVRRGRAFREQYQAQITTADGSFSFSAGSPNDDRITTSDAIDLQVIDGVSHAIVAVIALTPFVSGDGKSFIAGSDMTVTFTNTAGISVTVPAGAFDGPTLVTIDRAEKTSVDHLPRFDSVLAWHAGVTIAFEGVAKKRLEISMPAPSGVDATKKYFLGANFKSALGPRVMIVDLLRLEGGRFTTMDSPASGLRVETTSSDVLTPATVLTGSEVRQYLLGVERSATLSALTFQPEVAWALVAVSKASDLFVPELEPVAAAEYYVERPRVLVPVIANKAFEIIGVDGASGLIDFRKTYTPIPACEPGAAVALPSPIDNELGPYPVFASPGRLEIYDLTASRFTDESRQNLVFTFDGSIATLRNSSNRLPAGTTVEMLNLTSSNRVASSDFAAGSGLSLSAKRGDRIIVLAGAADVDPSSSITITFSEPVETGNDSDIYLRQFIRLLAAERDATPAVWRDYSTALEFDVTSQSRRVVVRLPSALPRGKRFRLSLSKDITETPNGTTPPLRLAQRTGGSALADDLHFDFSTRAPAGVAGTFNLRDGTVRDMAIHGNVLFVSALDAGLYAFDASDPASLANAMPFARIEAPLDQVSGDLVTPGQNWAVVADPHGRIYTTAVGSTFGLVRSYRFEDFIANPNTTTPPVIAHKASAIVSWRPGVNAALPITSSITLTDRPEAIPRKLRLLTQDNTLVDAKPFPDLRTTFSGTLPESLGRGFSKSTLTISVATGAYLRTRVTVANVTSNLRWSIDVPKGGAKEVTVIGRETDQFTVEANARTYGVVSLFGHGVGVFDLNAVESNAIRSGEPGFDSAYVPLEEKVIITRAELGGNCSNDFGGSFCVPATLAAQGGTCPLQDLLLSPEAAIVPGATSSEMVVQALDQNRGLIEVRITPPTRTEDNQMTPLACTRANSLVLSQRIPGLPGVEWFGHPILNAIRDRYKRHSGREPVGRYASIATYSTNGRTYGLISAFEYGIVVVELAPLTLSLNSLADVIWIPAGAQSVRVLAGQQLATIVDGKGRVLLVDLTHIDGRDEFTDQDRGLCGLPSCTWPLFKTVSGALPASGAPIVNGIEVGNDDPRIVWKSEPGTVTGTLPPLVDPDTGFVYTGDVNGKRMSVISAVDPQMRIVASLGAGGARLSAISEVVPLGLKPSTRDSSPAFRVEIALPGSLAEALSSANQELRIAIENESAPGALTPQMPPGFPRSQLRRLTRSGAPAQRGTNALRLQRAVPPSADPVVQKLRYQRGFNHFVSPWIVAIADPRASASYVWPDGVSKEVEGCFECERPAELRGKAEPDVFELFTNGRIISVRPEVCGATQACPQGTSIFAAVPGYEYLGAGGRMERRLRTYVGDTVRAPAILSNGVNANAAAGALQETTFVHSGELSVGTVDLVPGGRSAMSVAIDRTYRSRTVGATRLGLGWESSLFERLRELPNGDVEYHDASGEPWLFSALSTSPVYVSPRSLFVTLKRDASGGWEMHDQRSNYTWFDGSGRLVARGDRFVNPRTVAVGGGDGNVIRYFYDAAGNLAQVMDPLGRITLLRYWPDDSTDSGAYPGYLREIEDWRGRSVSYEYDRRGRLIGVLLPQSKSAPGVPADEFDFSSIAKRPRIRYAYPDIEAPAENASNVRTYLEFAGNLEQIIDPAATTPRVSFGYDASNELGKRDRVVTQTWGTGEIAKFDYPSTLSTIVTDVLGQVTKYTLVRTADERTQIASIVQVGVNVRDFDPSTELPVPRANDSPVTVDLTTMFEYDTRGEIRRITYPTRTELYTNDVLLAAPGTVVSRIEEVNPGGTPNGLTVSFEYDTAAGANALLRSITRADGVVSERREMQTASRARLKTWNSVIDTASDDQAVVGTETVYNRNGEVERHRVLDRLPSESIEPTAGEAVREETITYFAVDAPANARGRVKTTTDGTTTTSYDYAAGELGGEVTTILDAERKVLTKIVTDAMDRTIALTVSDQAGTVVSDERFGYDASGRQAYARRRKGSGVVVERFAHDASNRLVRSTIEQGAEVAGAPAIIDTKTEYDLAARTIIGVAPHVRGEEASAARTITRLDAMGRTIAVEQKDEVTGKVVRSAFAYDRSGSLSFETDTVRNALFHRNDTRGRRIESRDASGLRSLVQWSPWDEITWETSKDAAGTVSSVRAFGRLTNGVLKAVYERVSSDDREPMRVRWFDWNNGQQVHRERTGLTASLIESPNDTVPPPLVRPVNKVLMAETEMRGARLFSTRSGEGTGTRPQFNEVHAQREYVYSGGLPTQVKSREPRAGSELETILSYDALGRQIAMTAAGFMSEARYDELGNVVSATPPGMSEQVNIYDGRGLLLKSTAQDSTSIRYTYDGTGAVASRTDEQNQTTRYHTDALGRSTKVEYPDGTTEMVHYEDVTGLPSATKNRAGQWRSFVYNVRGDVTEIHAGETPVSGNVETMIERRAYDSAGRLATIAGRDAAIEYRERDLLGRPHVTRTYRYRNATGLGSAEVVDVHTQGHEWNEHDERTRWRMPARGLEATSGSGPWSTWIDVKYDGSGNVVQQARASSRNAAADEPFETATGRSSGRLFERSHGNLKSAYLYDDSTSMLRGVSALRGSDLVGGTRVVYDASQRLEAIELLSFGGRTSMFGYTARGWLAGTSATWTNTPTIDTISAAGFRSARLSPTRLSPSEHDILGSGLSLEIEAEPWNASEEPGHRINSRDLSLDNAIVRSVDYAVTNGRRTKDGDWELTYDDLDRLVQRKNDARGRLIRYEYDPNDRVIGRTAWQKSGESWALETRPQILTADGLPPDTTFVWDPMADRLVAIFGAGQENPIRQYIGGDQGYDDPIEILVASPDGSVTRYLPVRDEPGTGNINTVFDTDGFLVERVLYADAWGDEPRYLQGPVVDRITFEVDKNPAGELTSATVRVNAADNIVSDTVVAGLRLRVVSASGAVIAAATSTPIFESPNTVAWKLTANEWTALATAAGAAALEIAVTDELRATAWGPSMPFAPIPAWATRLYSGASSTPLLPVIKRESLNSIAEFIASAPGGNATTRVVYAIPDLYLAASSESKTKLLTGFKAAPFIEPATGHAYFRARWYDPSTGSWLTPDPSGYSDSSNLYAGFANDPVNNSDPRGEYIESAWDLASLGLGAYQISQWDEHTSFWTKALDVGGVVVDTAALALPLIPGGAGAGLRAYRAGDAIHDAYTTGRALHYGLETAQGIDQGLNTLQAGYNVYQDERSRNVGWGTGLNALQLAIGLRSLSTRGIGGYQIGLRSASPGAVENYGGLPLGIRKRAGDWQAYEARVASLYGGRQSFKRRRFQTFVDGEPVTGIADNVTKIDGIDFAVEAKLVRNWATSIRNPQSPLALGTRFPFGRMIAAREQTRMLQQARKYSNAFGGGVIYHSNSQALIDHYSRVFREAGLSKFSFVLTE